MRRDGGAASTPKQQESPLSNFWTKFVVVGRVPCQKGVSTVDELVLNGSLFALTQVPRAGRFLLGDDVELSGAECVKLGSPSRDRAGFSSVYRRFFSRQVAPKAQTRLLAE